MALATVALLGVPSRSADAHGGHEERLRQSTRHIAQDPADAFGYLHRADLLRRGGRLSEAQADLDRAAAHDPALPEVGWMRAQLLMDRADTATAAGVLDSLLNRHPGLAEARVLLAEALAALNRPGEAADQMERAIPDLARTTPEHYLSLAEWLVAARPPRIERCAATLAAAIDALGPVPALVDRAVQLELSRGRPAAALEWHERMREFHQADPAWHVRAGELLEAAGKTWDALAEYTTALERIEALPRSRRDTPGTRELEARVRRFLQPSIAGRRER